MLAIVILGAGVFIIWFLPETDTPPEEGTPVSSSEEPDLPSTESTAVGALTAATSSPTSTESERETAAVKAASSLPGDSFALGELVNWAWLQQEYPSLALSIEYLDWVQDGLDGDESKALQALLYGAAISRPVASTIISFNWVQDGITEPEAAAIEWLNNFATAEAASSVVALPGVQDGIEDLEASLIEYLSYIANEDVQAGVAIMDMPFLETIESPDVEALMSLARLVSHNADMFVRIMSHPTVRDGISDDLSPIVATLYVVASTSPDLIDTLLDPLKVSLESRAINLPLAGNVALTIIRTGPGATRSMDLLEHAVRNAEDYMGLPFPTNQVILLYEDTVYEQAVPGTYAGSNFGTHIAIHPKYDVDDGSFEAAVAGHGLAHEVAHFYWNGNAYWIDEGAAEFMAAAIYSARTNGPEDVTNPPCAYATSIAELEALDVTRGDIEFRCNYALGERLFVDLYRTLGDQRFWEGYRTLFLASEIESLGIDDAREAFRSGDGIEENVISRWYGGTEPYDLSNLDAGPVDPSLPNINGHISEAYVSMGTHVPKASTFSASEITDWIYLTMKFSYDVEGGHHKVPLEIVEYFQDGFEFYRQNGELSAEGGFYGAIGWVAVGTRPAHKWATGHYGVQVFVGERKVADVSYEIIP